jgi:hypothetical protein
MQTEAARRRQRFTCAGMYGGERTDILTPHPYPPCPPCPFVSENVRYVSAECPLMSGADTLSSTPASRKPA